MNIKYSYIYNMYIYIFLRSINDHMVLQKWEWTRLGQTHLKPPQEIMIG